MGLSGTQAKREAAWLSPLGRHHTYKKLTCQPSFLELLSQAVNQREMLGIENAHLNSKHLSSTERLNQTVNRLNQCILVSWRQSGRARARRLTRAAWAAVGWTNNSVWRSIGTFLNLDREAGPRAIEFSCGWLLWQLDPAAVESISRQMRVRLDSSAFKLGCVRQLCLLNQLTMADIHSRRLTPPTVIMREPAQLSQDPSPDVQLYSVEIIKSKPL